MGFSNFHLFNLARWPGDPLQARNQEKMPTFVKSVVEQGSEGAVTPRVNVRRPEEEEEGGAAAGQTAPAQLHNRPGSLLLQGPPPLHHLHLLLHPLHHHKHQHHRLGYSHFPQRPQVCPSCRGTGMTQNVDPSLTSIQMYVSLPSLLQAPPNPLPLQPSPLSPLSKLFKTVRNREKPFVRAALRPGHY